MPDPRQQIIDTLSRSKRVLVTTHARPDVEQGWPADFSLDGFDALLVVDTGTWSQLPGLRERIEQWNKPKLVLDHHLTQQEWADVKLVDTKAAAAAEVAAELLDAWGVTVDVPIATAL